MAAVWSWVLDPTGSEGFARVRPPSILQSLKHLGKALMGTWRSCQVCAIPTYSMLGTASAFGPAPRLGVVTPNAPNILACVTSSLSRPSREQEFEYLTNFNVSIFY